MANSVTLAQRYTRSPDVLSQEVGGEAVLLDLAGEQYFGLNPVGLRVWELLASPSSLQDVHTHLCAEFDADPARIQDDLLAVATAMLEAGLLREA